MKNGKYYRIRKELIWGMGLLAAPAPVFLEQWKDGGKAIWTRF